MPNWGRTRWSRHGAPGPGDLARPAVNEVRVVMADLELPCSGCAHSASGAPFPGYPSGERPCGFCVRFPDKDSGDWPYCVNADGLGIWYDGTPAIKTPMDNYITVDRLRQQKVFTALEQIAAGERVVPERGDGYEFYRMSDMPEASLAEIIQSGAPPCCEGGSINGHASTCMFIVGFSFG